VIPLQEHGHYEVAFDLLKQYGNDLKGAIDCLRKGKLFLKAIFEARMADLDEAEIQGK